MQTALNTDERSPATLTSTPIEPGESGSTLPEFGRISDVERIYGLKRGVTYALIRDGKLWSVCLRKPGAKTRVRLVHLPSVRALICSQIKGGNKMSAPENVTGPHDGLARWLAVLVLAGKAVMIAKPIAAEIWRAFVGGN